MLSTRIYEIVALVLTLAGLGMAMFLDPYLAKTEARRRWMIIDREFIELDEEEAMEVLGR